MANDDRRKSFWTTLPGIMTGIAALITAVGSVIGALALTGVFGGGGAPNDTPTPTAIITPTTAPVPSPSLSPTGASGVPSIVNLGCPESAPAGDLVKCIPVIRGDVELYSWSALDADSTQGHGREFSTSFLNSGLYQMRLEVCNQNGCAEDAATVTITHPPILRQARLTLRLVSKNWADLETEQTFQGFTSLTIGKSAEVDLYLAQTPSGLALWGGSTLNQTSTPTLKMAMGDLGPAGWGGCGSLLADAQPRGVGLNDLNGRNICILTTGNHVAEFRVIAQTSDEVEISYTVWE